MKRLLFLCAVMSALTFAQESRGTFSGSVTDSSGAAIANVKVQAVETRTGTKSSVVSETSGAYTIPFLAPGAYELSAEASGFKKFVRQGITLNAGEHPVIDIRLEVGGITESVEVHADAPLLATANPTIGQVITTAEVEDIPVNGRTPMMLDNLALGVISTFEPGPVRPFDNGAPNQISIGGASVRRNEVLLNGAPNAGFGNDMAYSPMQDAVEEVRVNLFDMDASFGHTMGGTVNLVTKQGTNAFHGVANIFNQTSVVDANNFFNNAKGVPRPPYHQNQYGITGGGPVWIPKVWDGRNRLFWFFGYEGMRDSDPANSPLETGNPVNLTTVPTAAERKGDFSALLGVPGSNNYTIYDPFNAQQQGTQIARPPFPANIIPQERLNPIALNYLKYFPLPNTAGLADGRQNYVINAVDSDAYDNELGRLDVNATDRNKLSFDVRHNFRKQNKNDFFGNPATGNFLFRMNQGVGIDDVYTIAPTVVAEVRGNWTRYEEHHFSPADGIDPTLLGFPGYIAATAQAPMLPYLVFTNTTISAGARAGFEPLGYNGDGTNYSDSWQLFGQVMKIHGNHTLKVGTDMRQYRWSAFTYGNPSGTYTFCCNSSSTSTSTFTNNPAVSTASSPIGQDFAAFLLGLPSSGSLDLNAHSTVQSRYFAFFVHDDWRVKSNLTLNIGLRWEHDTPEIERFNRAVDGFDPTATNPITAAATAAYAASPNSLLPVSQFKALGGLTFAGPDNRDVYSTKSAIFSPRFGFAWTPAKLGTKTVLRGGIGVLVDPIQMPQPNQAGYSQSTQMIVTNNSFLTPAATLSDPFPNGFVLPAGSSKGTGTFLGQAISFYNPNIRNPYALRWEFSVQRQLPGQMVLEVAYIGNHGMRQLINRQLDGIPRQYLSTSLVRDNAVIAQLTGTTANPFKGLLPNSTSMNGSSVQLQQLLAPFPQYPVPTPPQSTSNGIVETAANDGSSYYESLNIRLQKRFTDGLTLINNFIWNRLIDRLGYLNDSDPVPEKRISGDSRPFRNVLAATYKLPIGRGRKLNLPSRWLDALAGGWGLSGVYTLQSGPTLSWGNYIYFGGPLNLVANNPNGPTFDTTRFDSTSTHQLADNIRYFDTQFNNLRRDRTNQLDLSMDKNFRFGERRYLQVRIEAYNVPNHVTFGNPQTNPTSGTAFGTIGSQANTPRRIETGLRLVW